MKFTTRKWAVLTSKIDKLFIVIGITIVISCFTSAVLLLLLCGRAPLCARYLIRNAFYFRGELNIPLFMSS